MTPAHLQRPDEQPIMRMSLDSFIDYKDKQILGPLSVKSWKPALYEGGAVHTADPLLYLYSVGLMLCI